MIYGGTLPGQAPIKIELGSPRRTGPREVTVEITIDTSDFVRQVTRVARQMTVLDVMLEVIGMTTDQVWATFYVRGAMDPEFETPDAVDLYLNALLHIRGDRGAAARDAFLRGWAEHRSVKAPTKPVIWHRHIGDTSIQLGPAEDGAA